MRFGRDVALERRHERPEPTIDAQHLVVDLTRVGSERVADGVGGRQRDRQQVGHRVGRRRLHRALADARRMNAIERERERQRIHPRILLQARAQRVRRRQHVRKEIVGAVVLRPHGVGLRIRALRQQQLPLHAGEPIIWNRGVERAHPRRERVGVVATRREHAARKPIDVALPAADRQDGAAVLARHGQHARRGVVDDHPIIECGAVEPARRRPRFRSRRSAAWLDREHRDCSR